MGPEPVIDAGGGAAAVEELFAPDTAVDERPIAEGAASMKAEAGNPPKGFRIRGPQCVRHAEQQNTELLLLFADWNPQPAGLVRTEQIDRQTLALARAELHGVAILGVRGYGMRFQSQRNAAGLIFGDCESNSRDAGHRFTLRAITFPEKFTSRGTPDTAVEAA